MDTKSRIARFLIPTAALLLLFALLIDSTWRSNAEFHTLTELAATLLAFFVGIVALVRYYSRKSTRFLILGTAFLGTGLLDGYHALVTSSFLIDRFPSGLATLIPWSWSASRTFLSALLFLSWLVWRHEDRGGEALMTERRIYSLSGSLALFTFIFFAFFPLPRAYYSEFFFHRPQEFGAALFFLLALIGYWTKNRRQEDSFELWLIASLIVGLLSQGLFMSSSAGLFDAMFDAAHLLKVLSYLLVFVGLVIDMYRLFRQAEEGRIRIEQANAELETLNADLRHFSYAVTHDLKSPLHTILGFLSFLEKDLEKGRRERLPSNIERIRKAALHMNGLIEDILRLGRADHLAKELQRCDLGEIMREAEELVAGAAAQRGVRIDVAPDLPAVTGDRQQLLGVFQNLLENAVKYIGDQEAPYIEIGAREHHQEVALWVRDNGPGIDPSLHARAFELFERLHHDEPGSGVGLAIAKRVIEAHRGRIRLESDGRGNGTTFWIVLPLDPRSSDASS